MDQRKQSEFEQIHLQGMKNQTKWSKMSESINKLGIN
jgi:hypothetical protein